MTSINIDNILKSSSILAHRITSIEGTKHGASWIFNQCMRAFDAKLPAEAITFKVFFNAPVMKSGFATIHKDGSMNLSTKEG